jgi:hypothetical protein
MRARNRTAPIIDVDRPCRVLRGQLCLTGQRVDRTGRRAIVDGTRKLTPAWQPNFDPLVAIRTSAQPLRIRRFAQVLDERPNIDPFGSFPSDQSVVQKPEPPE